MYLIFIYLAHITSCLGNNMTRMEGVGGPRLRRGQGGGTGKGQVG